MRFTIFSLSILVIAPTLTLSAPIASQHFEELEARWNNPLRSKGFKNFVHKATDVYHKVAPVAKTLAPLILKREDEMGAELYRRELPESPTSPSFTPHVAKHAHEKRGAEHFEELEARWKNPFRSKGFKNFVHKATDVYKKVAPIAKTLAPLVLKREDEMEAQILRRDPLEASNFAPKHAHERRGEYEELEARNWEEFADEA